MSYAYKASAKVFARIRRKIRKLNAQWQTSR